MNIYEAHFHGREKQKTGVGGWAWQFGRDYRGINSVRVNGQSEAEALANLEKRYEHICDLTLEKTGEFQDV